MPVIIGLVLLAIWGGILAADLSATSDKRDFKARCDAQHGTVLMSLKRNGDGWIGCYSGLKEIPNEV